MRVKEFSTDSSAVDFTRPILEGEGIEIHRFPPGVQKTQRLVDASIRFFGFILPEGDFRWQLAYAYLEAKDTRFKRQHLENAMRATYLSPTPSKRNGEPTTITELNIRQVSRALSNLAAKPMLMKRYEASNPHLLPDSVRFQFVMTDRIQETDKKGAPPRPITPCPEALYQLRLFYNGEYLARVGFNIHRENELTVASIANIQGRKGGHEAAQSFREEFEISPFNAVVQRLKALAVTGHEAPITMRGLRNPINTASSGLYNAVFKSEGIPRLSRV